MTVITLQWKQLSVQMTIALLHPYVQIMYMYMYMYVVCDHWQDAVAHNHICMCGAKLLRAVAPALVHCVMFMIH